MVKFCCIRECGLHFHTFERTFMHGNKGDKALRLQVACLNGHTFRMFASKYTEQENMMTYWSPKQHQ